MPGVDSHGVPPNKEFVVGRCRKAASGKALHRNMENKVNNLEVKANNSEVKANDVERIASGQVKILSETRRELQQIALDGEDPCKFCPQESSCMTTICVPYYIHFARRWEALQKKLLGESK